MTRNPSSIKEIEYARSHLGAIGTVLLTNADGHYLGDPLFTPFFKFLNSRNSRQESIFIHPQTPFLRVNQTLVPANPSESSSCYLCLFSLNRNYRRKTLINVTIAIYPTFFAEFFFDTARTVMSLTLSGTLQNFTKINYQLPHAGDAWPSVEDRLLKSGPVALEKAAKKIYNERYVSLLPEPHQTYCSNQR